MNNCLEYSSLLEFRLEALMKNPSISLKYCHYRSVKNFITHFNKLKNVEQDKIFMLLNEYFDKIDSESDIDRIKSVENFNKYIRPVGLFFEENYNFMPMLSWWVVLFWLLFIFMILNLLNISFWIFFIIGVIITIYYFIVVLKIIKNEAYGFMW